MAVQDSNSASTNREASARFHPISTGPTSLREHVVKAMRLVIAPLSTLRSLMKSPSHVGPAVSCDDPAEAYLHACIASPIFSYVSPDIYSLCDVRDRIENEQLSKPDDEA